MNYYAIPPLLTAFILLGFGCFVFLRNTNSKINKIFAIFTLSMFVWLFCFSMMYLSNDEKMALIYGKFGFIGIIVIPFLGYHFVISLLEYKDKFMLYVYLLAMPAAIINFFTNLIYKDVKLHFWGFYPVAGPLYFIFIILFAVFFSVGAFLLYKSLKKESMSDLKRNQIKYVLFPFLPGTFAVVDYFSKYPHVEIYPFGYLFTLFFVLSIGYAIAKYRLMDIKVVFTKAGIMLLTYTMVLGIPFYLQYKFSFEYLPLTVMFMLATAGPIIYRYFQKKAENIFLAEQKKYQDILSQAAAGMVQQHDLDELIRLTTCIIEKSVKTNYVAAYVNGIESDKYVLNAITDSGSHGVPEAFTKNELLIKYIEGRNEPFTYEEMPANIQELLKTFPPVGLMVPLVLEKKCYGFLMLGPKENQTIYSQDDMKVFTTLANQVVLAIDNCNYVEEIKRAQERVFAAEKLASIGGMAEGIAHQITNRLNQFSLNSEVIELKIGRFRDKNANATEQIPDLKEMLNEFSEISSALTRNVNRTYDIVKGIMNYSKIEITERDYTAFMLEEIVNPAVELLKIKHNEEIPIEMDPEDGKGKLYGVKSQLMEVVYNIIDNAYESTIEKAKQGKWSSYKPAIRIKRTEQREQIVIEIEDNGIGIDTEQKKKIFAPFFSTKSLNKSGSGIGMYIVKRLIEETHKGKVWFESEYTKGTRFYVELPSFSGKDNAILSEG